jgi:diacylglycerol kinase family enzyme
VLAAAKHLRTKPFAAEVAVDGEDWYEGPASLVLFGNVGEAFAGVKTFEHALADDGLLEVGVGSADGLIEWSRTLARSAIGQASKSPFVHVTKGRSIVVKLDRKVLYELDGGDRKKRKTFRIEIRPNALNVCVPPARSQER